MFLIVRFSAGSQAWLKYISVVWKIHAHALLTYVCSYQYSTFVLCPKLLCASMFMRPASSCHAINFETLGIEEHVLSDLRENCDSTVVAPFAWSRKYWIVNARTVVIKHPILHWRPQSRLHKKVDGYWMSFCRVILLAWYTGIYSRLHNMNLS